MDLSLVGGTYTWLNNRESPSWSKIDKFLVYSDYSRSIS
jgi:hypothetical protein